MLKLVAFVSLAAILLLIQTSHGFIFGHHEKCPVSPFKGGKEFSGEKIQADKTFVPLLKAVATVAKGCKVRVHVVDSFKQLKTPTEYVPASQLPLALGRGIHFDLQDAKGSVVCNKLCMVSRSWKTLPEAACFIDNVQKKGLKFTEPNLLHDGYAAKLSSTEGEAIKVATQKLCAPKVKGTKG